LAWIDARHRDARVVCGMDLGSWGELQPRWRLEGESIRLQWTQSGGIRDARVKTVREAPGEAAIRIHCHGATTEKLHVIWRVGDSGAETDSGRLRTVLQSWVRSNMPGGRVSSVRQVSDRAHSLSSRFLRARLTWGGDDHLVLIGGQEQDSVQSILTQALLWLELLRARNHVSGIPVIHLVVPEAEAPLLSHRARMLNPDRARVETWAYLDDGAKMITVRPPAAVAKPVENRDFRWPVLGPFRWSSRLARVLDLAPTAIQRYPRFRDYDSLRLWGLEFARVLGADRDRILFGVGTPLTELKDENFAELHALVREIVTYRRADSPCTDHPYYRMQAERWLECLLLRDVAYLFPELEPGCVYPQIPVYLGKVPGRVDILGIDRRGNLVVMEIKVAEDPDLPMQSLDYWGRVIGHNLGGDFERRGYFGGIRLTRARPRLYLVSPVFSFHDSLEKLVRCLDPGLEISRISINEDWRRGVKILRRIDCKCGELE